MTEIGNHETVAAVLQRVEFIHDGARETAHGATIASEQVLVLEGERRPLLGFMIADGPLQQEVGVNAFVPSGWAVMREEGLTLYNTSEAALGSFEAGPGTHQGLYSWAANVSPGRDIRMPSQEGTNLGGTLVHDLSAQHMERLERKLAATGLSSALTPKGMNVFYGSLHLLGEVSLP
jgi:hypothetical protein